MSETIVLTPEIITANTSDLSKINNQDIINKFKSQLYFTELNRIKYAQQVEKDILAQRNPIYVIMRILDAIPDGVLNAGPSDPKAELNQEQEQLKLMYKLLEELIDDCVYRPPEVCAQTWEDLAIILETYMPNEKKYWVELIEMIVQNKV